MSDNGPFGFRTIGVTTCRGADEAKQVLAFLDRLRTDIRVRYGEQVERSRHDTECLTALSEQQQPLDLDDPPF